MKPPFSDESQWDEQEGWYYAWRNPMRKIVLQRVWLDSRRFCPSDLVTEHLPKGNPDVLFQDLANWWDKSKEKGWVNHPIMAIAARLGFEHLIFTNHRLTRIGGNEFFKSVAELYPWRMQLWRTARASTSDPAEWVRGATHGLIGLRRAGYEADVESLVKSICSIDRDQQRQGLDDCATAIRKVEAMLDASAIEELRVLDEIEQAALKLDLYQYP